MQSAINTQYEAANKIDDMVKLLKTIVLLGSSSAGSAAMKGARTRCAMTGNRKRLGKQVGDVVQAADKHDTKVSLAEPVPDPMQTHVGGLGHPL